MRIIPTSAIVIRRTTAVTASVRLGRIVGSAVAQAAAAASSAKRAGCEAARGFAYGYKIGKGV